MLVKTFLHKIKRDYTLERGVCPSCGSTFARAAIIKNKEANKIIGGKVYTKGDKKEQSMFRNTSFAAFIAQVHPILATALAKAR